MARASVVQPLPLMEVNRVDDCRPAKTRTVNDVDRLKAIPLEMAKAKVGAAVNHAIGDKPLKLFGDKGLVSKVCTGEKVPEYLAQIYQDTTSRRRFALALLKGDVKVRVRTVVEFEDENTD